MTAGAGVVIVGGGTAGATAAVTLRSGGYDGPVTLIAAEPEHPYRRTALTKDLLAADLSPEKIALQKPQSWTERDIDLRSGVTVTSIDTDGHTVTCSDGRDLSYRALILATGGSAARPGWLGPDVATIRTLDEALDVRRSVEEAARVAVVGGGLIGLELAASAAARGLDVDVIEAADRLLGRVVPVSVSEWFADLHRSNGVTLHLDSAVTSATADEVVLADGSRIVGPVVAAVGMTPDVALAAAAGIETARAGIVVDDTFATSASDVYAAGDAAAPADLLTGQPSAGGHWFGATDQGKAVATAVLAALTGEQAPSFRDVPRAWTIQYGVNIQTVGWPAGGDVEIDGSLAENDATVRVSKDGRLVGAVTVGRAAAARACRAEIDAALGSTV
ncbi:reductase [Gordonia spumicola]|uniref:Reductase n=1 Tax=Gordonia spumicola TaxID=589161 RepID=A0A7I9V8N4_9ACTN|nr:FAD-dependent oxidoreductase [Gordonia spumicola]GEE01604.1 reductase [Gordonia spumicola]